MTEIRLHDTMSRGKRPLAPLDPANVRMYVCGPTVYDRAHLGNARPVVVFDVLFRLLRHVYGPEAVTYVRNLTDVDDKIIARAAEAGIPIEELTRTTTDWFHADMAALGALRPTHEPRATEHVAGMVAMIEALIERGHAYEVRPEAGESSGAGHVLFAVATFPEYGRLSGRSTDDMVAGARVEVAPYKRDPMDFVLWKPSAPDQPGWDSPWGRGRPGWHIECSAMAEALLGPAFDIHGGGGDLVFPHHENEIAQSLCAHPGSGFAQIWLHNEMLQVEGRKMSKSLGNFFTVRDLLDRGVPGEVIRLVMLGTHYRKPMDWTEAKAAEAEASLRRWYREAAPLASDAPVPEEVVAELANDLGTPGAIAVLHRLAAEGNAAMLRGGLRLLGLLEDAVPAWAEAPRAADDVAYRIERLLKDRAAARAARDFARADALRDGFAAAGIVVKDTPAGATWELAPDFDPARLEALG